MCVYVCMYVTIDTYLKNRNAANIVVTRKPQKARFETQVEVPFEYSEVTMVRNTMNDFSLYRWKRRDNNEIKVKKFQNFCNVKEIRFQMIFYQQRSGSFHQCE